MALTVPDLLQPRLLKPVAIFGGGVSGEGVQALLAALGATGVIYDAKTTAFTTAAVQAHALVVFSPGFAPEHPWLRLADAVGLMCLGELDFASLFWRGRVVAITGTNGKTTLTEFLTHALRSVGQAAEAAGNIGRPLSQLVAETGGGSPGGIAVCEASSFQTETLQHFQADATLWTNFAEDHLERHPGMEAYFSAKWNLVTRTPAGSVFAGPSVLRYARKFGRTLPNAAVVATEAAATDPQLAGTVFADYPQRENFLLAAAWWQATGRTLPALYAAARSFRLGRHRLTRVGEHDGVTFWNDSKATNFHAVEAALAGFACPVLLIAGGKAKGGDLAGFVKRIGPHVKHAFLIGETQSELATLCAAQNVAHTASPTLADAVHAAAAQAVPGEVVLLSPGFASFDMFRNYEDRGNQFEKLVRELGTPANLR